MFIDFFPVYIRCLARIQTEIRKIIDQDFFLLHFRLIDSLSKLCRIAGQSTISNSALSFLYFLFHSEALLFTASEDHNTQTRLKNITESNVNCFADVNEKIVRSAAIKKRQWNSVFDECLHLPGFIVM